MFCLVPLSQDINSFFASAAVSRAVLAHFIDGTGPMSNFKMIWAVICIDLEIGRITNPNKSQTVQEAVNVPNEQTTEYIAYDNDFFGDTTFAGK